MYTQGGRQINSNDYWEDNYVFNYTKAIEVMDKDGVEHYLAPRYQMCPVSYQMYVGNLQGSQLAPNGTMCLKWLDTDKEKEIGVGVSWPYEKLSPFECLISETFGRESGLKKGDQFVISVYWGPIWPILAHQYNEEAQVQGWPTMAYTPGRTTINCNVKDLFSKTYGKMPESMADQQIILEFEYFISTIAQTTEFDPAVVDEATALQFEKWMLSIPDLSYQYAGMIIANLPSPRYETYENSNFDEI